MRKKLSYLKSSGLVWLWLSAVVVVADQLSKMYILERLAPGQNWQWLPFFNISLAFNSGSAYGFLANASGWHIPFIVGVVVIVCTVLIVWLAKLSRRDVWLCLAVSLIVGGAIGNLIDRLRFTYVIDFFDFHIGAWHFATFNVADAAISIGAVLLALQFFFASKKT